MQQVRDYREYFSRRDTETARLLKEKFGYQPVHPTVAVLIGRREHAEGLDRIQGDANDLDLKVVTYDDLVEFEEKRLILQGTIAGVFV